MKHVMRQVIETGLKQVMKQFKNRNEAGYKTGMKQVTKQVMSRVMKQFITQEIENYIKTREVCQKTNSRNRRLRYTLQITATPKVVWEKCSMDFVGPLTVTTEGHKYILTFQDK
jgi:ketol-acid reductoisomerase